MKREVYIGVRWFYRYEQIDEKYGKTIPGATRASVALNNERTIAVDFAAHSDEVIFSDHYDENNAAVVGTYPLFCGQLLRACNLL